MVVDDTAQQPSIHDRLDDSDIPEHELGKAYPTLRLFHVKLEQEGILRGIIGPRDAAIVWERHILNSAAVVPFVQKISNRSATSAMRIADLGSGGGFPGLVVAACMPSQELTLIEPMQRRTQWLDECVSIMGLTNVEVIRSRAQDVREDIAHRGLRPFDVVICRAVAPMKKLAAWSLPLLKRGGTLIALKGRTASEEIDKASAQIRDAGGINARVVEAPVAPGLEATHIVLVDRR